jgi:hypothetical protein
MTISDRCSSFSESLIPPQEAEMTMRPALALAALLAASATAASADPVRRGTHDVAQVGRTTGHAALDAGRGVGHVLMSAGRGVSHAVNHKKSRRRRA